MRLSPTADLTAGLFGSSPPARIYTLGLLWRPAPLREGVTDSNYEEVRGRGGFAAGYLLVRRRCGNDRTRCLRFCRDN